MSNNESTIGEQDLTSVDRSNMSEEDKSLIAESFDKAIKLITLAKQKLMEDGEVHEFILMATDPEVNYESGKCYTLAQCSLGFMNQAIKRLMRECEKALIETAKRDPGEALHIMADMLKHAEQLHRETCEDAEGLDKNPPMKDTPVQ